MSGASVSRTIDDNGSVAASCRMCRARPTQRAAETEPEAERDELVRLLSTAIEGMRDATRHRHTPQVLEHPIHRTAHMQQHRQAKVTCNPQLFDEEVLLPLDIDAGNMEVEADLTQCDHRSSHRHRLLEPFAQQPHIALARLRHVQRMDAISGGATRNDRAALADGGETRQIHRRHDDRRHPGGTRRRGHRRTIVGELPGSEVAVRVDQQHRAL